MPIDNFAQQDSPVVSGSAEGTPFVADRSNNVGLIRSFNQTCDASQGPLPKLSITGLPEGGMLPTANGPHRFARTGEGQPQVQPVRSDGRTITPPSPQTILNQTDVRIPSQEYRPVQGDRQNADFRPQSPFPQNTDGGFTPEQLSEIFRMRDRAMSLHRGEQPAVRTTDGTSKPNDVRPANDIRLPNDTNRPTDRPNQRVKFETSEIDQAIETARQLNKPLIVKLGFPGCGACQKMGRESWPHVKDQLAQDAVFVDVNVQESEEAAARFPAGSYPTVIGYKVTTDGVGRPSLQEMGRDGFMDRNTLSSFLSRISQQQKDQR